MTTTSTPTASRTSIISISSSRRRRRTMMPLLLCLVLMTCSTKVICAVEYCLPETFNVTCAVDEIIMVTSAQYGRMHSGRCIKQNYGHVGCMADVTASVENECSGRRHCQFPVAQLLGVAAPCPTDVTSYLEATHKCVRVPAAVATSSWCTTHGYLTLNNQQDGYIPLSRAAPGARRCPWKIVVDANQRIEFSVLAFGLRQFHSAQTGGGRRRGGGYCAWSLVFEEASNDVEESLCRVSGKETVFYTSTTNSVTAYLLHKQNQQLPGVFLLKFKALGCPRLKVGDNVWIQQDRTTAKVKCNSTEETWFLACNGREWTGELGNCSSVPALTGTAARDSGGGNSSVASSASLPYGFIVAVVIGVVLGVLIGAIPLGFVYLCLKRKWRRQPAIYMHDGGFYPDLDHVVQSTVDDDASRPCSTYPALLKDSAGGTAKTPAESISSRCCSITHGYSVGDPGLYWDGCRTPRPGVAYRSSAGDCPAVTTFVAADGTLLRSVRRADHVYESASFAGGRCPALLQTPDADDRVGGHVPTSVVYYEVDAAGEKPVTRTPLIGDATADLLPVSRGQQSVI